MIHSPGEVLRALKMKLEEDVATKIEQITDGSLDQRAYDKECGQLIAMRGVLSEIDRLAEEDA